MTKSNEQEELKKKLLLGVPIDQKDFLQATKILEHDSDFRQQFSENQKIHQNLVALANQKKILNSEDRFVAGVMDQIRNGSPGDNPTEHQATTDRIPSSASTGDSKPTSFTQLETAAIHERQVHGLKRQNRKNQRIALAVSAAVLVFLIGGYWIILSQSWVDPSNTAAIGSKKSTDDPTFVCLTKSENARWNQPRKPNDRFGKESVELLAGNAEFTFDNGTHLKVEGPAIVSFEDLKKIALQKGKLVATVDKNAIGFTVDSPNTRVVDLGTVFEVFVLESGQTDVRVISGKVTAESIHIGTRQKYTLTPGKRSRASFYPVITGTQSSPIISSVENPGEQFIGKISLEGKSKRFSSKNSFDTVRRRIQDGYSNSPQQLSDDWAEYVQSSSAGAAAGHISINGETVGFSNFDETMSLKDRFQFGSSGQSNQSGSFSGSIEINGKRMTFSNQEEFEKARKKLFGAAAKFGAGVFN